MSRDVSWASAEAGLVHCQTSGERASGLAAILSFSGWWPSQMIDPVRAKIAARAVLASVGAARAAGRDLEATFEASLRQAIGVATCQGTCPKVRFGRTELQIPVLSCGGMRIQQKWGSSISAMEQVEAECQANFVAVLRRSFELGVNHFETARGYGCSELQYGQAFQTLFNEGTCKREDLIIQTKVGPKEKLEDFIKAIDESFAALQLEYVDLFAFHGVNRDDQLRWIFSNGLWEHVMKLKAEVIIRVIETGKFDYVNLHYHFCGSYTASGAGTGPGNAEAVAVAAKHDMGVFIISPYDKGGKLYSPSTKLFGLCAPDLTPMQYGSLWLWEHARRGLPAVHTIVCGAARPSDLDEPVWTALTYLGTSGGLARLEAVESRLDAQARSALGDLWVDGWWRAVPSCWETDAAVFFSHIAWLHTLVSAFGMHAFARDRYKTLESNSAKWDEHKDVAANLEKQGWGYCPGLAYKPALVGWYRDLLLRNGCQHTEEVLSGCLAAHEVLAADRQDKLNPELISERGWDCAFEMQPDTPWPQR